MAFSRKPRSTIDTIALVAIIAALSIELVGYGLAWSATARCADALYEEASAQDVRGRTLHGDRVLLTRDAVHAQITGPFEVTAWISMPRDLHATIYSKRFRIWPWGTDAQKTEVLYAV
ncbi:hypothetical protein LVB87_12465 [Lysobacter sp. KIS68-7]|uniref:hypothetical protein n=1 Tax=Lysobacter sp. KIS68-7 TaxID=2904252 RepID=UPI001E5F8FF8|nr:hypothetical protein [Lysobacter sp. KIS68-7]UHQ18989.1 hypothetical protein LVB87_12465 [Lysobacter sp. KIS68-7]